jgi:hypothetical protein
MWWWSAVAIGQGPSVPWSIVHSVRSGEVAIGAGALALSALPHAAACARGGRIAFVSRVAGTARNQAIVVSDENGLRAIAVGCGGGGGSGAHGACGDPAPGGGTIAGLFEGTAFAPALSERGDVLFLADVHGGPRPRALFCYRADGDVLVRIAAVGDAAPGGGAFASVGPGVHMPNDGVLFVAQRVGMTTGEVFAWRDGVRTPFLRVGDPLPQGGTIAAIATEILQFVDGTSIPIGPLPCVDACGSVAVRVHGAGGAAASGIVVRENGVDAWWLRTGEGSPVGGAFTSFGAPLLARDADGQLQCAVFADHTSPRGPTSGWFVGRPSAWRRAIGFFDPVDGGQCLGLAISRGPMTPFDGRDLVVWCDLAIDGGQDRIVLCHGDGSRSVLARRGDPLPGGGALGELGGWPSLDAAGRCLVSAHTQGSAGGHFVFGDPTPRVAVAPCTWIGGPVEVFAHGLHPGAFVLAASPLRAAVAMPPLGTLAIGPDPVWLLTGIEPFAQAFAWSQSFALPSDPALEGAALHFQALALEGGDLRLTKSASTRVVRLP